MQRDLSLFQDHQFDILVIGGGIHGVCVAWDAALRGLSVALVDQADFGHATSANSLKIIHGGLRYLQEANLPRMRAMIRERKTWLRIAPGLVRPLPFILPTGGKWQRSQAVMRAALLINDLVSFDCNHGLPPDSRLPHGRILSQAECLKRVPGLPSTGVSGGALWYDGQLINSERLLFSILRSAVNHGAIIANYAEVTALLENGRRVVGAELQDSLTGHHHTISARLVFNCSGAWSNGVLGLLNGRQPTPTFHPSTAINLVTRQILPDVAVGLPIQSRGKERILFIVPWQDYSLAGTWHQPYSGAGPGYRVDEATIQACLDEVNAAYPAAALTRRDVYHVHAGYLPAHPHTTDQNGVRLIRESAIYDHGRTGHVEGLVTVMGVKYTTARLTAQRAVDLALRKLGRPHMPCHTHQTVVTGKLKHDSQPLDVVVIQAIRCEMAQTLADIVRRRADLGAAGPPEKTAVATCARLMAAELGWNAARQTAEINALYASYEAVYPTGAAVQQGGGEDAVAPLHIRGI